MTLIKNDRQNMFSGSIQFSDLSCFKVGKKFLGFTSNIFRPKIVKKILAAQRRKIPKPKKFWKLKGKKN